MRRLTLAAMLSVVAGCAGTDDPVTGATAAMDATSQDPGAADGAATAAPDTATPDAEPAADVTEVPDPGPPPFDPKARVFLQNPVDSPEPTEVTLQHLTAEDHRMTGEFARVQNCLPDPEGGQVIPIDVGGFVLELRTCNPTNLAFPGDDGTYRHIAPPENHGSLNDAFSELMMYHHIQVAHDYFRSVHGLKDLDFPLDAMVNLQVNVTLCDQWATIPNAAFVPSGSFEELGVELDLGIDGPAILFGGSTSKNFSYDADVIYHEYTHAMVGATRLSGAFIDDQGLNNTPGALNEAFADYFAASLSEDSVIGTYALNAVEGLTICGFPLGGGGQNLERDLATFRRCPDDLTTEVHADGEIVGSALWAIRTAIGATQADAVIMAALAGFTNTTGFIEAAEGIVDAAAELLEPAQAAAVEKAFTDRGMLGCARLIPADRVGSRGIPLTAPGPGSLGGPNPFAGYVPAFAQVRVARPDGARLLRVTVKTVSGFAGFGGGGDVTLEAAFKPGNDPVVYGGGPFLYTHDAPLVVPFTKAGESTWVAEISGNCVANSPVWSLSFHNKGSDTSIVSVTVTSAPESPEPTPDCGG